jgi:hypothetical protein
MPIRALGPTYAGGIQPIVQGGYSLIFLPDVNNWELQRAGESPVFYWVPNQVRMARKQGPDTGDYLFNLIRFSGVQSADTTVGATEDREVAGGVLTFTVTGSPPAAVMEQCRQQIIAQYQASDDYFWGIRAARPPVFRPAIIRENTTTISNISPVANGRGVPVAVPRDGRPGAPLVFRTLGIDSLPQPRSRSRAQVVSTRDTENASNLEPWFWNMQGEGKGSIDPSGTQGYSALLGAYPTAILWESFHGTASPVTVMQNMKLAVWTPVCELTIRGNWDRVFQHFSAAVQGRYLWASADLKAEFNNMRQSGTIDVDLKVDPTIPGGDKVQEAIEKRSDLVFQKFMDQAMKVIFEPPQPTVEPAQASSGFLPWGVGVGLKYRRDSTSLDLFYHESRQMAYLQEHAPSSSLAGMFEEIHADPGAEQKYFRTVFLDDWPRKLARLVKPVVAWNDGAVDFVSIQLGYPNTSGEVMWEGHAFQKTEAGDDSWKYRMSQKSLQDVSNPPQGWEPGKTFVKRKVHLKEPPSEIENPYRRIQVDRNVIDLDPEPNGILLNDTTLEVRADSAGRLAVGPITLGVVLQDNTQTVEVTLEPTDGENPPKPIGRDPVRFIWNFADQDKDRLWLLFTGDPEFQPFFRYRVRVIVKGTLFEAGKEWEGPWQAGGGNGPITITIPRPGDQGVTARAMPDIFVTGARDMPRDSAGGPGAASRDAAGAKVLGWTLSRT